MRIIEEIVDEVEGIELRSGNPATSITSITHDSRQVVEGTLFVAMRGERLDGHQFVGAAVEKGAAALLVAPDFETDLDLPILVADDPRKLLADLGWVFYKNPSKEMMIIGITGTNGKTSTAYLLESIFTAAEKATGVIGTVEYRWPGKRVSAPNTTPDGLVLQRILRSMADDGVEVVILEVSSHGLEKGRVAGVYFDAAIFTNLSQDHLDFHPTMEAYRDAKRRLFFDLLPASAEQSNRRPVAVINIDDEEGRALLEAMSNKGLDESLTLCSYGFDKTWKSPEAIHHMRGCDLVVELSGLSMTIEGPGQPGFEVRSKMPGRFNGENVLGAAAAAELLGVEPDKIAEGLASSDGVPGRMQRVGEGEDDPAIFVDYAHTPDALRRALETLRPLSSGEVWVVFGCGGNRDRSKRPMMGEVAGELADQVVITSDNPRSESPESIIDAIIEGVASKNWQRIVEREEAITTAIGRATRDDVILIAGKGHETYQEIQHERRDFDDRAVAQRALAQRGVKQCNG